MDDDHKFPEQKAPEKNTDNAYVQVGEDGLPVTPQSNDKKNEIEKENNPTTLDKRWKSYLFVGPYFRYSVM